jgi:hypothetical protein
MITPCEEKFVSVLSAVKITVTDFWVNNGVNPVNFLSRGMTVSSD